jgi:para-nitrobenzyl esterase
MPFGQTWVDAVLAQYPAANYATPQAALVQVFSDMRFTCPTRAYSQLAAASQSQPLYRYWWSRQAATAQGSLPAAHGLELLYVFGTISDIPLFTPAAPDLALSDAMMTYWTAFAHSADPNSGDPNGGGLPTWPLYGAANDDHIVLDDPIAAGTDLKKAECDMWDSFYAAQLP